MTLPAVSAAGLTRNRRGRTRAHFPWLQLVVLSTLLTVFAGVVAEIALRVAELRESNLVGLRCLGAQTLLQGQKGLYVLDSTAGYTLHPDTCVRLRSTEYDGVLRTNAAGMVGPPVTANKPAGEFRIVVLGDSYTVGGQVPYEQTFPAVLEQRLHAAGYPGVRVIDAGVGGYTTFNEAGLLRERMSLLQPNLVVVAAFLGNDVSENVLATAAGYRDAPEHPKGVTWGAAAARLVDDSGAWFRRNNIGAGALSVPPPWDPAQPLPEPVGNQPKSAAPSMPRTGAARVSPTQQVRTVVHAFWGGARASSLVLGRLFGVPADPSVTTAPGAAPLPVQQRKLNLTSFEWTILRDIPHTYWLDVAWPLFGRYLDDIRRTAGSVPVVLLAIPEMSQFDDQMHAQVMRGFRFAESEVDWERPQRELAAQADRVGVPELDLLPLFRARADRDQLYLRIDTHFTALGHQVTADALADYLQASGWLK